MPHVVLTKASSSIGLVVLFSVAFAASCSSESSSGEADLAIEDAGNRQDVIATGVNTAIATQTDGGGEASIDSGRTPQAQIDAAADAAPATGACPPLGTSGSLSPGGTLPGVSEPRTAWAVAPPAAIDSIEWTLAIDRRIPLSRDGYQWFGRSFFIDGQNSVTVDLQEHGEFQLPEPGNPSELTQKIELRAVGAIGAETLDIARPNGYVGPLNGGLRVHVKYPWTPCILYRFRIAREDSDASGRHWYSASITALDTCVTKRIGRVLMPSASSALRAGIGYGAFQFRGYTDSCGVQQYASALFGPPTSHGRPLMNATKINTFEAGVCPRARITDFPDGAVRHEMGMGGG